MSLSVRPSVTRHYRINTSAVISTQRMSHAHSSSLMTKILNIQQTSLTTATSNTRCIVNFAIFTYKLTISETVHDNDTDTTDWWIGSHVLCQTLTLLMNFCNPKTQFTRYNLLSQLVWQPVGQQVVSYIQTSNRLSNRSIQSVVKPVIQLAVQLYSSRLDNRLQRVNTHPTGCQTVCTTS